MLDEIIMKPPITSISPPVQDMMLQIHDRRESGRHGKADAFRNTLDIQSINREKTDSHSARPQRVEINHNLLRARAAKLGIEGIIQKAAQAYHLDPDMIASIIQAQSNFDPKAESPAGAQGLMQLMPATAAELGVTDPFEPEQNIMAASRYLNNLVKRYDGDLTLALKAYTWGMGNVDRNQEHAPAAVERFVASVSASSEGVATARRSTASILAEMSLPGGEARQQSLQSEAIELRARQSGVDGIIRKAADTYDLSPKLITAVIHAESDFDNNAVSHAGAQGLMQLMPATAAELGVTDPFDPEQNVMGASRYLKGLVERYDGDLRLALAAYNWGMGNLERHPGSLPRETTNYIAKIMALMPDEMEQKAATIARADFNPEKQESRPDIQAVLSSGHLQPGMIQAAQAYSADPGLAETAIRTERNSRSNESFEQSMLSGHNSTAGA